MQRQSLRDMMRLSGSTLFDLPMVERLLDSIDIVLRPVENKAADYDVAVRSIQEVALNRINDVLTPAILSVRKVQEKGYLMARSTSAVTIGLNDVVTLAVGDPDERALFQPSPFVLLTREANMADFAIGRRIDWSPAGDLVVEIVATWGDPGPHHDWILLASAGLAAAQLDMLADSRAIRDEVEGFGTSASLAAGQASGSAAAALNYRNQAGAYRDEAEGFADAAATFNPANFVTTASLADTLTTLVTTAQFAVHTGQLAALESLGTVRFSTTSPGGKYARLDGTILQRSSYAALSAILNINQLYDVPSSLGSYMGGANINGLVNGPVKIAYGSGGAIYTNTVMGSAFTQRTPATAGKTYTRGYYFGTRYFLMPQATAQAPEYSDDGVTWTNFADSFASSRFGMYYDPAGPLYLVYGTASIRWSTTPGGIAGWSSPVNLGGAYSGDVLGVVKHAGLYIAHGAQGFVRTSPDGKTWTARTPAAGFSGTFRAACVFGGYVYLFGTAGEVQRSPDGLTWTRVASGQIAQDIQSVAVNSKGIVAVSAASNVSALVTTNGQDWTPIRFDLLFPRLDGWALAQRDDLLVSDDMIVLPSSSGYVLMTHDLETWEAMRCGTANWQFAKASGGDLFMVDATGNVGKAARLYDPATHMRLPLVNAIAGASAWMKVLN